MQKTVDLEQENRLPDFGKTVREDKEERLRKQGFVTRPTMKKDAMALMTGRPVYTDDMAPSDCLIVKALRSPHAHALVKEIHTEQAKKVPGVVCVLTWKDSPQLRFTQAGQTYPEPSPYDR